MSKQEKKPLHDENVVIQLQPADEVIYTEPSDDYFRWAIASIFVCFIWGALATRSSFRVQRLNESKEYTRAAHYSRKTRMYIVSAIASCIVLALIIGVPFLLSLTAY